MKTSSSTASKRARVARRKRAASSVTTSMPSASSSNQRRAARTTAGSISTPTMRARGASARTTRAALPPPRPRSRTLRRRSGGSASSPAAMPSQTEPVVSRPGCQVDAKLPSMRSVRRPPCTTTRTRPCGFARLPRGEASRGLAARGEASGSAPPVPGLACRPSPGEDRYTRAMGWDLFERAPSHVVRVALPVPVDRLFDYEVPEDLAREAEVGRRVRVPFGGRRLTGVIVETGAERGGVRARGGCASSRRSSTRRPPCRRRCSRPCSRRPRRCSARSGSRSPRRSRPAPRRRARRASR